MDTVHVNGDADFLRLVQRIHKYTELSMGCYGFSKLILSMPSTRLRFRLVEDKNDY